MTVEQNFVVPKTPDLVLRSAVIRVDLRRKCFYPRSSVEKRLVRIRLNLPALVNLGIKKKLEQVGIQLSIFDRQRQDLDGALQGHGFFVWTVGGRKRIEDVGDRHHAGLH